MMTESRNKGGSKKMPSNSNAAYDFSLFEPKSDQISLADSAVEPTAVKKQVRKVKRRSLAHPMQAVRWTAAAAAVIIALCAIMYCNVQNTKLNDQVESMKTKLNAAKSEEVRLDMQLQSRSTLSNVESYATNTLGMQKITPYQVEYIHLEGNDKVEVQKTKKSFFASIHDWIVEYL